MTGRQRVGANNSEGKTLRLTFAQAAHRRRQRCAGAPDLLNPAHESLTLTPFLNQLIQWIYSDGLYLKSRGEEGSDDILFQQIHGTDVREVLMAVRRRLLLFPPLAPTPSTQVAGVHLESVESELE